MKAFSRAGRLNTSVRTPFSSERSTSVPRPGPSGGSGPGELVPPWRISVRPADGSSRPPSW